MVEFMPFQQKGENGPSLDFVIFCPFSGMHKKCSACEQRFILLPSEIGMNIKGVTFQAFSPFSPSNQEAVLCTNSVGTKSTQNIHFLTLCVLLLDCLSLSAFFSNLIYFREGLKTLRGPFSHFATLIFFSREEVRILSSVEMT